MAEPANSWQTSPAQTLLLTRIIWAAMLLAQIAFMVVIAVMLGDGGFGGLPELGDVLLWIAVGLAGVGLPLSLFVRMQIYKRHWQGDAITPAGYFTGNLVMLAMCEGVAMFGLVTILLSGQVLPNLIPSLAAMALQVINFPHGRPMQSATTNPYAPRRSP